MRARGITGVTRFVRFGVVVAALGACAVVGVAMWPHDEPDAPDARASGRAAAPVGPAREARGDRPARRTCTHPLLSAEPGVEWRYRFERPNVTGHVVLRLTDARDGERETIYEWRGSYTEGTRERSTTFTTRCRIGEGAEMPVDAFLQSLLGGDAGGHLCVLPMELTVGTTVRATRAYADASLERTCRVALVDVELDHALGPFHAIEMEVETRGTIQGDERTDRTTHWLAANVGLVRAEIDSASLELESFTGSR